MGWEPILQPTYIHTHARYVRVQEERERGRNCKHACNSARANQNVMSLRCDDDDGRDGGDSGAGGDLCAGKKRCHKSCYSPLFSGLPAARRGRRTA